MSPGVPSSSMPKKTSLIPPHTRCANAVQINSTSCKRFCATSGLLHRTVRPYRFTRDAHHRLPHTVNRRRRRRRKTRMPKKKMKLIHHIASTERGQEWIVGRPPPQRTIFGNWPVNQGTTSTHATHPSTHNTDTKHTRECRRLTYTCSFSSTMAHGATAAAASHCGCDSPSASRAATCDAKAYDGPVSGSFDAAARRGARRGQRDEDGPTILVVLAKRCDVQSHKSSKTDSNSRSCVLLSRLCTCELVSVRNQGISVCLYAQTPLASCLSSPSHDLMLSLPTTLRLETTK